MGFVVGIFDIAPDASPKEKSTGDKIGGKGTIDRKGDDLVEGGGGADADEAKETGN